MEALIQNYQAGGKIFSGILDREENRLVSGCLAEGMELADLHRHPASRENEEIQVGYALCRPPGHHAEYDQMGGYCYLK